MGGIVDAVFGGGDDAPEAPDPYAVANAQGTANIEAARVATALNRANQITPYGNLTWSRGGNNWDETGYNSALNLYNEQLANYNSAQSIYNANQSLNRYRNDDGSWQYLPPQQPFAGTAPKKEDYGYNPDAWTSTVTLDPRIQSLLDASLATSQGLQGAIGSSLANTTSTLSQPLNGVNPVDVNGSRSGVNGRYTNLQPSLVGSTYLAATGRNDMMGQLSRLRNLYDQNFSYKSAPNMPGVERINSPMPSANQAVRNSIENALYARSAARLNPRFQQSEDRLASNLAAQGITQGSEAYNREMQNFNNAKNDAYSSAMNDAIAAGGTELQRQFGMDMANRQQQANELNSAFSQGLQARQQGVNEANTLRMLPTQEATALANIAGNLDNSSRNWYGAETAQETAKDNSTANQFNMERMNNQDQFNNTVAVRNQILNELNALRTGAQAQTPQFGNTNSGAQVAASPIAQSVYNSYQGDLANYQAGVGSSNAMLGGLATLGGAAMRAPAGTFAGLAALF